MVVCVRACVRVCVCVCVRACVSSFFYVSWTQRLCPLCKVPSDGQDAVTALSVKCPVIRHPIVQELCESRGGRPGLSVLTSLLVSVDVKIY